MMSMLTTNVHQAAYEALMLTEVADKLAATNALWQAWQAQTLSRQAADIPAPQVIETPGRPIRLQLVHHTKVKQRGLGSEAGRNALLHAVAHIEFNAINLALDAVYRFREMPDTYYGDWLQVAAEEAHHFSLLTKRMQEQGMQYGDLPAHNGLWEQACKTDHDVLVRMALVPRVLEARGLDVTPPIIERLTQVGDLATVRVLEIILRDEIGHVRIGSYWYRYCCGLRNVEPEATFRQLVREIMQAPVRGPFYTAGRLQAGFSAAELQALLQMERDWMTEVRA